MDDRCHEAWREIGGFLDLRAGRAKDKGSKKGSESAQIAPGFVGASTSSYVRYQLDRFDDRGIIVLGLGDAS
jgi:hypothetical protein